MKTGNCRGFWCKPELHFTGRDSVEQDELQNKKVQEIKDKMFGGSASQAAVLVLTRYDTYFVYRK